VLSKLALVAVLLGLAGIAWAQEVIDSVDVGGWNVDGLTYNSRAGVVYGRCYYGHSVFAIDCSTDQLVAQIPLIYPIDVAYSSTSNKAYCTFSYHEEDSVLVIDGASHTRLRALALYGAYLLLWDSVSNRMYVNCFTGGPDDCVAVIDCETDSVVATVPIPGEPVHLTLNTRRRKLYCQNDYDMTVSVIDMNTNLVIRNVYTGSPYFAQCYSAAADKYYTNGLRGVAVIDGATDSVIKHVVLPQGYLASGIAAVDQENRAFVATSASGPEGLYVLDTEVDTIVSFLATGRSPAALTFSVASGVVYCANRSSDNVSVVVGDGSRVLSTMAVADYPQDLLVCPSFEKLYVGHGGETNMVYVVRDRLGVTERHDSHPLADDRLAATLVRRRYRHRGATSAVLVGLDGRQVAVLEAGENDLGWLPAGVYLVLEPGRSSRRKVVKTEGDASGGAGNKGLFE